MNIDIVEILSKELSDSINRSVVNLLLFDNRVAEIKTSKRNGLINSILEDTDFIPINIENIEYYKLLSEEYKKKYKKYGKIL